MSNLSDLIGFLQVNWRIAALIGLVIIFLIATPKAEEVNFSNQPTLWRKIVVTILASNTVLSRSALFAAVIFAFLIAKSEIYKPTNMTFFSEDLNIEFPKTDLEEVSIEKIELASTPHWGNDQTTLYLSVRISAEGSIPAGFRFLAETVDANGANTIQHGGKAIVFGDDFAETIADDPLPLRKTSSFPIQLRYVLVGNRDGELYFTREPKRPDFSIPLGTPTTKFCTIERTGSASC